MVRFFKRVLSRCCQWWPWGQKTTPSSSSTVIHTLQHTVGVYSSAIPRSTSTIPDPPPPPRFFRRAITRAREAIQHVFRTCHDSDDSSFSWTSDDETTSDIVTLTINGWLYRTYSRDRVHEWRMRIESLPVQVGVIHEEDEPGEDGPVAM